MKAYGQHVSIILWLTTINSYFKMFVFSVGLSSSSQFQDITATRQLPVQKLSLSLSPLVQEIELKHVISDLGSTLSREYKHAVPDNSYGKVTTCRRSIT